MTVLLAEPRPMAKERNESVRLDSDILRKARVVAADRGMTIVEYLSETLRPVVEANYAAFIDREAKGKPQPPRR